MRMNPIVFFSFFLSFRLISSIFWCLFYFSLPFRIGFWIFFCSSVPFYRGVAYNDATDQIMKCLCDWEVWQYVTFYYVVYYNWISMNMKTNASISPCHYAPAPFPAECYRGKCVCFCVNVNISTDVQYMYNNRKMRLRFATTTASAAAVKSRCHDSVYYFYHMRCTHFL